MTFRCLALLIGSFYLLSIAGIFAVAMQTPIWISLPIVVAAAGVVMFCLGYFAVRVANREGSMRQIDPSALLLLLLPLSIYLAALQRLFQLVPRNSPVVVAIFTVGAIVFIAFSSMILLWMAEALVAIAAAIVKIVRDDR